MAEIHACACLKSRISRTNPRLRLLQGFADWNNIAISCRRRSRCTPFMWRRSSAIAKPSGPCWLKAHGVDLCSCWSIRLSICLPIYVYESWTLSGPASENCQQMHTCIKASGMRLGRYLCTKVHMYMGSFLPQGLRSRKSRKPRTVWEIPCYAGADTPSEVLKALEPKVPAARPRGSSFEDDDVLFCEFAGWEMCVRPFQGEARCLHAIRYQMRCRSPTESLPLSPGADPTKKTSKGRTAADFVKDAGSRIERFGSVAETEGCPFLNMGASENDEIVM